MAQYNVLFEGGQMGLNVKNDLLALLAKGDTEGSDFLTLEGADGTKLVINHKKIIFAAEAEGSGIVRATPAVDPRKLKIVQ